MKEDFCRGWLFCKKGQQPTEVNLPHDAMLMEERSTVCNNGERTGYYPGGEYYYEKKFVLTEQEAKGYVAVRFGGVYRHATVYLNGLQIAAHRYGYTPFTVNLSGKVSAEENKIAVDSERTDSVSGVLHTGNHDRSAAWGTVRPAMEGHNRCL